MNDRTKAELESGRAPFIGGAAEGIEYCLTSLMKDKSKNTTDFVVPGLMFEELIGTLLLAQDEVLATNKALDAQKEES
jgi:hypothetical protein